LLERITRRARACVRISPVIFAHRRDSAEENPPDLLIFGRVASSWSLRLDQFDPVTCVEDHA
jgi:hypothetical protein